MPEVYWRSFRKLALTCVSFNIIDIAIDVCVLNLFSDSVREFRLKAYTLYVLYTINIVRGLKIPEA